MRIPKPKPKDMRGLPLADYLARNVLEALRLANIEADERKRKKEREQANDGT